MVLRILKTTKIITKIIMTTKTRIATKTKENKTTNIRTAKNLNILKKNNQNKKFLSLGQKILQSYLDIINLILLFNFIKNKKNLIEKKLNSR